MFPSPTQVSPFLGLILIRALESKDMNLFLSSSASRWCLAGLSFKLKVFSFHPSPNFIFTKLNKSYSKVLYLQGALSSQLTSQNSMLPNPTSYLSLCSTSRLLRFILASLPPPAPHPIHQLPSGFLGFINELWLTYFNTLVLIALEVAALLIFSNVPFISTQLWVTAIILVSLLISSELHWRNLNNNQTNHQLESVSNALLLTPYHIQTAAVSNISPHFSGFRSRSFSEQCFSNVDVPTHLLRTLLK